MNHRIRIKIWMKGMIQVGNNNLVRETTSKSLIFFRDNTILEYSRIMNQLLIRILPLITKLVLELREKCSRKGELELEPLGKWL